jgi:hypothetical protein
MKSATWISPLFWGAAAYDGVLGLMFLLAPAALFELCQVTPPNHFGYVQFPAALLIIFGWIFGTIARDPLLYRFMIPYGILLKVARLMLRQDSILGSGQHRMTGRRPPQRLAAAGSGNGWDSWSLA